MNVKNASKKAFQYAESNLTLVGWMGFIGFPLYYVVWQFIFPQPYENLTLRLICSLLFLGLIIRNQLNKKWFVYFQAYYQITITFCLPFFFFYMLLMNQWSTVWLMSFMIAIFLHILLVHITWLMFAQSITGISLAVVSVWASDNLPLSTAPDWVYLPIFLFVYVFGNAFYVRNQIGHESRTALAKTLGAGIAHEMRNPLASLSTALEIIETIIPSYKNINEPSIQLSISDIKQLHETTMHAKKSIYAGQKTIDLLLSSIDESKISCSSFQYHSVQAVVEQAVESFCYQRTHLNVSIKVNKDFEFLGSELLLLYVVYNLLKNAVQHGGSDVSLQVIISTSEKENQLIIEDNGKGMSQEVTEKIFDDFFSTGSQMNSGLGLPFCRKVICAFGGDIQCKSEEGKGTTFAITFPTTTSESAGKIQQEVLNHKKGLLLVSDNRELISGTKRATSQLGISSTVIDISKLLSNRRKKIDFGLVVVDVESLNPLFNHFDEIDAKLSLSNSRVVYLSTQTQDGLADSVLNPVWINVDTWSQSTESMIVNLLLGKTSPTQQKMISRYTEYSYPQKTIMVVDDNDSLRMLTSVILEKQGFEVIQSCNGREALLALEKHNVDLILMDIDMPAMNGLETAQTIRNIESKFSQIPIIAHTGDISETAINDIKLSGIYDHLHKPARQDQLLQKIADWI